MSIPAPSAVPRNPSPVEPPVTRRRRGWRFGAISGLVAAIVAGGVATAMHADAAETLLSQGKPATASSSENAGAFPASAAVDGNTGTRWSSAFSDPQWLQVDLGATATITRVALNWEAAAGKSFEIQTSNNATTWTSIYSTTTSTGGNQSLTVNGSGRYVRMYGTARTTGYGYSLWEFQVFGGMTTTPPTTTPPTTPPGDIPGGGSLGANVIVFDPSQSTATIQSQADTIFRQQESNQFGTQRYVLAFKPGTYNGLNIQVGFYTSVLGLGQNPQDTRINGDITVDAGWMQGNATQNFWRSVENLSLYPVSGADRWAVSQAAPYRRMHVRGNLALSDGGWSSGGFIADSKVDGQIQSGSQQQFLTRNSQMGSWNGSNWNQVFVGDQGAPGNSFPSPPYTTIAQSPAIAEKPYLYVDSAGAYQVFVPALRNNVSGTTWANGSPAGNSLAISTFYVVKSGDSATTINAALAAGKNLLVTPGVYHLNQTLNVTRANTVVLGLGLATFVPDNGVDAMHVADVDGVKVAGLLFDAGTTNSAILMQVGPTGSTATHAANPTVLSDVFFRLGGAIAGKATVSLQINSNNVIGDHAWIWRADHSDNGTNGWNINPGRNGLVVNGNDVTFYGLFVEHFQQYQTIWNGNNGRTYFYQNEMPYDPPNQAAYMNGSTQGWAAYKVADSVTNHEAWGLGSYCYFNVNSSIVNAHAFEVPVKAGVKFHNMVTVSLGGIGTISHVINNTGDAVNSGHQVTSIVSGP